MQTVITATGDKLFIPDAKELCGKIVSLDQTGWVSLGWIGGGDSFLIDKSEWKAFVAFVNQIDAAIGESNEMATD
jgi:hypothetical protein